MSIQLLQTLTGTNDCNKLENYAALCITSISIITNPRLKVFKPKLTSGPFETRWAFIFAQILALCTTFSGTQGVSVSHKRSGPSFQPHGGANHLWWKLWFLLQNVPVVTMKSRKNSHSKLLCLEKLKFIENLSNLIVKNQ